MLEVAALCLGQSSQKENGKQDPEDRERNGLPLILGRRFKS